MNGAMRVVYVISILVIAASTTKSIKLFEDDLSTNSTEETLSLGMSLLSSDMDLSLPESEFDNSEAELGNSLTEVDMTRFPNLLNGFVSSTPVKRLGSDAIFGDTNDFDTDYCGQVFATTVPASTSSHLLAEVSPRESRLRKKALHVLSIKTMLKKRCSCNNFCIQKLNLRNVYKLRDKYWSKTRQARGQYLINSATAFKSGYIHLENGFKVCQKVFLLVLRVNKNAITACKKLNQRGAVATRGRGPKNIAPKSLNAICWLENYAKFYGDRMPDSSLIMLPYKTEKYAVYMQYKLDVPEPVSRSNFYRIWTDNFPQLKIKAVNSFSKCTVCTSFDRKLENTLLPSSRAEIMRCRQDHNQRQMLERKYYYNKREEAKKSPTKYLSLIIDGMDQSKSDLPHFTGRLAKSIRSADRLKTHISGVLNHGLNMFTTYVDINQFPHDPNLTLNILLRALQQSSQKLNNKLPSTLYLQADNCWRENKNKYVLAFCELLVRQEIFNEVHLSFLYVGHTHEDVDAAFSRISNTLRRNDAETFDQLLHLLPNTEEITHLYDIKSWLEPHIISLSHHTQPLHYKFSYRDTQFILQYKGNHDRPWTTLEHSMFQDFKNGKVSMPKNALKLVSPVFDPVVFERLSKQVKNIEHIFSNHEHVEWWNNFCVERMTRKVCVYPFILPHLPKQTPIVAAEPTLILNSQLQALLAKETRDPTVKLVKSSLNARRSRKPKNTDRKTNTSQTKKTKTVYRKRSVTLCVLTTTLQDPKRHIWYMIMYDIYSNIISLMVLIIILCISICIWTQFVMMLLFYGDMYYIIAYLNRIWKILLMSHIGRCTATVGIRSIIC